MNKTFQLLPLFLTAMIAIFAPSAQNLPQENKDPDIVVIGEADYTLAEGIELERRGRRDLQNALKKLKIAKANYASARKKRNERIKAESEARFDFNTTLQISAFVNNPNEADALLRKLHLMNGKWRNTIGKSDNSGAKLRSALENLAIAERRVREAENMINLGVRIQKRWNDRVAEENN